ncbi:MAG: pyridoxamine 5'-phosphate oxidase family protein [Aristaeellaceae bacterium]
MRRKDREISERTDILAILERSAVIRLGMQGEEYPYVVPLSFGWEQRDGQVILYVHGAMAGKRHALLARNNRVAVEADCFQRYVEGPGGISCVYESMMGEGVAECVTGEEARHGLDCLLRHCGYEGYACDEQAMNHTSVWRITLHSLTGKRRPA